ncbi:MAG: stage II sporulation protein D [Desulfotomaculales bacterium]
MSRLIAGLMLLALALSGYLAASRPEEQAPGRPLREIVLPGHVRVYVHETGEIVRVPMEEYLVGVVAAEMPASFPLEALKAQAVCARTWIARRMLAGGVANSRHPGADACDDPRHGQGYLSREKLRARWGTLEYYRHYYRIRKAVRDTAGLVVAYRGELIDPVYHASCGGRTEKAADVWKLDVPYLQSVDCPYCEDPYPGEAKTFTLKQVVELLGGEAGAVPAATGPAGVLQVVEKTAAGRPKTVRLAGKEIPAGVVRDYLGLRSTNFTWRVDGKNITFYTAGHGHGVGLCQYGAKGFARRGYNFQEMLQHYYRDVKLTRIKERG